VHNALRGFFCFVRLRWLGSYYSRNNWPLWPFTSGSALYENAEDILALALSSVRPAHDVVKRSRASLARAAVK